MNRHKNKLTFEIIDNRSDKHSNHIILNIDDRQIQLTFGDKYKTILKTTNKQTKKISTSKTDVFVDVKQMVKSEFSDWYKFKNSHFNRKDISEYFRYSDDFEKTFNSITKQPYKYITFWEKYLRMKSVSQCD